MVGATEGQAIPVGAKRPEGDYVLPKNFAKGPRDLPESPKPVHDLVLECVKQHPGLSAREISERIGKHKTIVATELNHAERHGEVFFKQPPDGREVPVKHWYAVGYLADDDDGEDAEAPPVAVTELPTAEVGADLPAASDTIPAVPVEADPLESALAAALSVPTLGQPPAPGIEDAARKSLFLLRIAAWPGLHEEVADMLEIIAADLAKLASSAGDS